MTHHDANSPPCDHFRVSESGARRETRIVLRPVANPLPLAFLALAIATTAFASIQLGWISQAQGHIVALGILALSVPMQLLAAVVGFLARDPIAATGIGIVSGTWGAMCLGTLASAPGAPAQGLGVILVASAVCLLVPGVAAYAKAIPALVIGSSAVRFAVTGIAEIGGGLGWMRAAGWVGLALGALSFYAAVALEFEASTGSSILPLGRLGPAAQTLNNELDDQIRNIAKEPGVRQQL